MNGKYINPYTDFGFKKLFGTIANRELLLDLLNELVFGTDPVSDLHYMTTERLGKTEVDRKVVFDIYCETESGEKIVVEMQRAYQKHFKDRGIYYSSVLIQEQGQKGKKWKYELKPVYVVGILNFVIKDTIEGKGYYRHEVKLIDDVCHSVHSDKLTYIHVEMPKFNKTESELETKLDKWLYALKNLPELDRQPAKLRGPVFDRLFREARIASFTKSEMWAYEQSVKAYRDNYSVLETYLEEGHNDGLAEGLEKGEVIGLKKGEAIGLEKGLEKGEAIGLEKGEAIGLEKGEAIGLEKGEAIGLEKGEAIGLEKGEAICLEKNVMTCHRNGMSIEHIETFFGLSRDKILEILKTGKSASN
jgi:predicted transposase/invertase (TIGR01784 family)